MCYSTGTGLEYIHLKRAYQRRPLPHEDQIEILGETPVSAILNELASGDLPTALSHDNSGCGGQKASLSRVLLLLFLKMRLYFRSERLA